MQKTSTLAQRGGAMRYTAAHWGAYAFDDSTGLHPIADDPAPSRIGRGWLSAATNERGRVLAPAIRRGWLEGDRGAGRSSDDFVRVSWDEAVRRVAEELARVRTTHGNGAIFAGSYGWSSAGRFHHAQSQLRRFLNCFGGFVGSRDTYSHAAAEVLFPYILGMSQRRL
ncbi:MAG: molybdopterin-dependent oxidoreductase [Boseongicola sp. SB0670_bin_30]|nr:molybdopterin-dependent oxidoreductase [Boseongicola sp. SB0670_bin_30]